MPLGSDNNQNNGKLYILKVVTQDAEKKKLDAPVFKVSTKNESGKWEVSDTVSSVGGSLAKVEVREQEYLGEKYNTVSVSLRDDALNETYLVDFRLNMLSRSILNSLLNLKPEQLDDVKIGLYQSKKGYPSASVRSGGDLVDWAYNLDEQPKPEEVKFKGKMIRDYTEIDNWFIGKLDGLVSQLSGTSKPQGTKAARKPAKKAVKPESSEGDLAPVDDDVF